MDIKVLKRLEKLNQLCLTEQEEAAFLEFWAKQEKETEALSEIDTENVERMVHVMPIMTVIREDEVIKKFDREALQQGAPDTDAGYWCVPRVVE